MRKILLTKSAVMLVLRRFDGISELVLLHRRQNTGYADGMWDCSASGHVEENESLKMAMIREAKEEIGIEIEANDLKFVTLIHKYSPGGNTYYNVYFEALNYKGTPYISEPLKCSELKWFPMSSLPSDLIEDRRVAIHNYKTGIPYAEMNWEQIIPFPS